MTSPPESSASEPTPAPTAFTEEQTKEARGFPMKKLFIGYLAIFALVLGLILLVGNKSSNNNKTDYHAITGKILDWKYSSQHDNVLDVEAQLPQNCVGAPFSFQTNSTADSIVLITTGTPTGQTCGPIGGYVHLYIKYPAPVGNRSLLGCDGNPQSTKVCSRAGG